MSRGIWMPGNRKKDCPLSKLKSMLNKITEEKFLPLSLEIRTLFEERIRDDKQLEECAESILEKAIQEPGYCSLYAQLCQFLSEERKTFKMVLLHTCQKIFQNVLDCQERWRGKRILGCVQIIGELYNINLIPSKIIFCDVARRLVLEKSDLSLDALCQLLTRTGRKMDEHSTVAINLNVYFAFLEKFQKDEQLSSRIRFLILDLLDLRKAKWQKINV